MADAERRAEVVEALRGAIAPPPALTVSQWADAHRELSPKTSGVHGRWRTDLVPYAREPLDCLSAHHPVSTVVLMWASQVGKTEIGLNWLGYVVDVNPGPAMAVYPTIHTAERWSGQRFDDMVASTPRLKAKVAERRSRDASNTKLQKDFAGGVLAVAGANSAASLASMPVRDLMLDEIDRYPRDVDEEGDPIDLAIQRTETFAAAKFLLISTPTIRGLSRIEDAYLASDQRRYFVPCPECGAMQTLRWGQVVWETGKPETACYCCEACGVLIPPGRREWMVARGEWRPTVEGRDPRVRGYHLSALYAPWARSSWPRLAERFVECAHDPVRLKSFANLVWAETWHEGGGDELSARAMLARPRVWRGGDLPRDVAVLTAGVDVQDDRLEIEVVGWGAGEESWSVAYVVIQGDTSTAAPWTELDAMLSRDWPVGGIGMRLSASAIDTGGHATQRAYQFCLAPARQRRRVWAVKGRGGSGVRIWPVRPTIGNLAKCPLYVVGVDAAKEAVTSRMRVPEPGPGFCHVPLDRDATWFEQMTSEVRAVSYHKGRPKVEWRLKRAGLRNEALDCRVYAYAALQGWIALGRRLPEVAPGTAARRDEVASVGARPAPAVAPAPVARPAPSISLDRRPLAGRGAGSPAPRRGWFGRG